MMNEMNWKEMRANDPCFQNMGKKCEKTYTFSDPDDIPTELWIGFQNLGCSMSFSTFQKQYETQHRYVLPFQWRAIASIPKDDAGINPAPEYFLLDTSTGISIGFWSKPERAWLSWESYRRLYPTHWQPLPCRAESVESDPQTNLSLTSDPLIDAAQNALYHINLAVQGRAIGEHGCGALDKAEQHPVTKLREANGGWRPIEDAPKDGTTWILCYNPDGDSMESGVWSSAHEDFINCCSDRLAPTHFRPLPAPPEAALDTTTEKC